MGLAAGSYIRDAFNSESGQKYQTELQKSEIMILMEKMRIIIFMKPIFVKPSTVAPPATVTNNKLTN